jgi:hypothetical protein
MFYQAKSFNQNLDRWKINYGTKKTSVFGLNKNMKHTPYWYH